MRYEQQNNSLGEAIKSRRQELGLTIEDAASKAGVGTKAGVDMNPVNLFEAIRRKESVKL